MLKFHFNLAPNPMKEALPVDTRKGEQHSPAFKAVNPNAKVPAIEDDGVVMFDSNAILLWLADKHGRFVARDPASTERAQTLTWLMFIASGIGPFSGQSVHFRHAAPEPKEYALNRYDFEAHRHWGVLEAHLAQRTFMVGDTYSIVDMAFWGWARLLPYVLGTGDATWAQYPNVKRLLDAVSARPAAQRAEAIKTRHTFKAEMDDQARSFMFPQNERLKKA
jgi:GST-like protein